MAAETCIWTPHMKTISFGGILVRYVWVTLLEQQNSWEATIFKSCVTRNTSLQGSARAADSGLSGEFGMACTLSLLLAIIIYTGMENNWHVLANITLLILNSSWLYVLNGFSLLLQFLFNSLFLFFFLGPSMSGYPDFPFLRILVFSNEKILWWREGGKKYWGEKK